MKEKDRLGTIGIIDHSIIATAMSLVDKTKAEVVVVDDGKDISSLASMKVKETQQLVEMLKYPGEKVFVCKGKHQYREVVTEDGNIIKGQWICQCGRKL